MTESAEPASTDLDAGEQARADIYRLMGALLAAPPDAALLELLRAIPLATEDGQALVYVANEESRVLGARTFHGDAICDDAVNPSVLTPEMPWEDVIFSSTFTSGVL